MAKTYFVTATDTDAGKTLITSGLLALARESGFTTQGLKPLAAGSEMTETGLQNQDALDLMAQSSPGIDYHKVNPWCYAPPIAPHIAARETGKSIDLTQLSAFLQQAKNLDVDLCLVEGAGGWHLPLDAETLLSSLVAEAELEIIFVVGMKLGCLNHALLTQAAIVAQGLKIAGWVANRVDKNMSRYEENLAYLKGALDAPFLGEVPYLENANAQAASADLSLSPLQQSR